jgi:hypothetical protein
MSGGYVRSRLVVFIRPRGLSAIKYENQYEGDPKTGG